VSRARRRDRRVYLGSHPVLFALLAATRRTGVLRLGGTVLVHRRDAYTAALTRLALDRTAEGTTGGAAARLTDGGLLFDQQGDAHRRTRRSLGDALGRAGVARLRPVWTAVLRRRLAPLADGQDIDLVPIAAAVAGATAAALLDLDVDADRFAAAARHAGATAARAHLPGLGRRRAAQASIEAIARLTALVASAAEPDGLATMLAVAAVNTTVAALPRAAAWCADGDLWSHAETRADALADELMRVVAPTPLLPRVAAAPGELSGCPVRAGDRLLLVARHAVDAHRSDPDPVAPAPPAVTRLAFGAGSHVCPGARLAHAQLVDLLTALAPYRPTVVRARVDRRAALPGWRSLIMRASR
jgi:cytochrome P450